MLLARQRNTAALVKQPSAALGSRQQKTPVNDRGFDL